MKSALDMDTRTPFEWEPCPKCSERLEYGTNGMGRVVTSCPVCDWGHRPARKYDMFERRQAESAVDMREWSRCICGDLFPKVKGSQRYCSDRCRQRANREQSAQWRAKQAPNMRACVTCGEPIVAVSKERKYCDPCGTEARRASRKASRQRQIQARERVRSYWQNKGAA